MRLAKARTLMKRKRKLKWKNWTTISKAPSVTPTMTTKRETSK
jgi:hypothetical protein